MFVLLFILLNISYKINSTAHFHLYQAIFSMLILTHQYQNYLYMFYYRLKVSQEKLTKEIEELYPQISLYDSLLCYHSLYVSCMY